MTDEDNTSDIAAEIQALRTEISRLNGQRFFRLESSIVSVAGWNFVRGLAFGLGSVIGATILVAVLVKVLSTINFIPILGDWAQQIIDEINAAPRR